MKTWDVFTTADQLRNAIRALLNPGDATATNTYLGFGTDNLPRWLTLPTATAVTFPTATNPIPNSLIAKAWAVWDGTTVGDNPPTRGQNVSSVNRTAAGKYTINFATGASATTYLGQIGMDMTVALNAGVAGRMGTGSQLATAFDAIVLNGVQATDRPYMTGIFYW